MLEIRLARPEDASIIARFRVMLFKEMGRLKDTEAEFAQISENYFEWAILVGREVAWIAEEFGDPVSVLSMTIEPMPPKPGRPRLIEAYMHNVYTLPSQRLRGFSKRLVITALEYAEKEEIARVRLFTSNDARQMYESLGFVPHTRYLERKL